MRVITRARFAPAIVSLLFVSLMPSPAWATTSLTRVSLTDSEGEFTQAYGGTVSADHQKVAFVGQEPLVGRFDTYVRDISGGTTENISVDANDDPADAEFYGPIIAANGNYVVFSSPANDLADGDTGPDMDVFRRNLSSDTTKLVSADELGEEGNAPSGGASISANGRYVAFTSEADNLVEDDGNDSADVFVKDMQSDEVIRVSVTSAGDEIECPYCADWPSISADGNFVAFMYGGDLTPNDSDPGGWDIYRHNVSNGNTIDIVENDSTACQGTSGYPAISEDGSVIAFVSDECDLVGNNDTNDVRDAFAWEAGEGIDRVSVQDGGGQSNDYSDWVSVSPDGSLVGFTSWADNLVNDDTNEVGDSFVFDRSAPSPSVQRITASGTEPDSEWQGPAWFASNSWAVFDSGSSNLVNDDTNPGTDVFLVAF